jgi:hypothetical protein
MRRRSARKRADDYFKTVVARKVRLQIWNYDKAPVEMRGVSTCGVEFRGEAGAAETR